MSKPHYGGNLVDGAQLLSLFGDVATELCVRADGDEGLFRAYDSVEFLAPVFSGDFIEARGEIVSWGRTSLKMRFTAHKVIAPLTGAGHAPSAAQLLGRTLTGAVIGLRGGGSALSYDLFTGTPVARPEGFQAARTVAVPAKARRPARERARPRATRRSR